MSSLLSSTLTPTPKPLPIPQFYMFTAKVHASYVAGQVPQSQLLRVVSFATHYSVVNLFSIGDRFAGVLAAVPTAFYHTPKQHPGLKIVGSKNVEINPEIDRLFYGSLTPTPKTSPLSQFSFFCCRFRG